MVALLVIQYLGSIYRVIGDWFGIDPGNFVLMLALNQNREGRHESNQLDVQLHIHGGGQHSFMFVKETSLI